jgi:hypothetical protein
MITCSIDRKMSNGWNIVESFSSLLRNLLSMVGDVKALRAL